MEAEAGVLGSILIEPNTIVVAKETLKPGDFFRDAHRAIYGAMLDLWARGVPSDIITVTDELGRHGRLDDAGGVSYVGSLTMQVPTASNIEYYARIVWRTAVMRRVIETAGKMAAIAYNEPEADIALEQVQKLTAFVFAASRANREYIFPLLGDLEVENMKPSTGILGDILYANSIALLYAKSGRWKSFLALAMGYAIAIGGTLFGRQAIKGPVLYIAAEGAGNIGKRLGALRRQHEIKGDIPFYLLARGINLLDATQTQELIADSEAQMPSTPAIVFIDTVARSMPGGDENVAKDVNTLFDAAQRIKDAWGCCVVLVHHDGKETNRGARGSSALYANADTVLRISGAEDKTVIIPGEILKLECEKPKDDTPFDPIPFTTQLMKWATDDGETRSSLIILPASAHAEMTTLNPNQQRCLDTLFATQPDGITTTDWLRYSGIPRQSFYDARKWLDDRGFVRKDYKTQRYFPSAYAIRQHVPSTEVRDRYETGTTE
jgi:hypothetical protein